MVSVTTVCGAFAKPGFGILTDYFNTRLVFGFSILFQFVGLLILVNSVSLTGLMVGGGLFGLGYGAVSPLWAILLADLFGRESFAQVMGAMMPLTMMRRTIMLTNRLL